MSNNLSRDELAHLLGASQSSDILATARPDPKPSRQTNSTRTKDAEPDVSTMDSKQAAALVARQFDRKPAQGGVQRHRAQKTREYHLMAEDLEPEELQHRETRDIRAPEEPEEDAFAAPAKKRKKIEATVVVQKKRRESSSSESDSSSDESSRASRRKRRRGSTSSDASDDSADLRRRRAREKRKGREEEMPTMRKSNDEQSNEEDAEPKQREDIIPKVNNSSDLNARRRRREAEVVVKAKPQSKHHADESSDSESSTSSGSSSSSSSISSSDDSNHAPQPLSKPLFVPKSKRGTIAEQEAQQQKIEEIEQRKEQQKQKRTLQSRALVAEAVAEKTTVTTTTLGDEDEFEGGGVNIPDDSDDTTPESEQIERDAWEVRELIRILHESDILVEIELQKIETERRRNMSDREVYKEGYHRPGEARKKNDKTKYLQRFHHRGAFYMDEDTLEHAGKDDVRHRAAEYSRAATGEDKIDKSLLPEVMQVKKFGFAGYSTKYKGLAKEDTTDKQLDFVPIRSRKNDKRR